MNAIKRVAHAFKHTYNATLVRSIAYLIGLFYFVVANDLFWTGNADWNTPLMTVLFNATHFRICSRNCVHLRLLLHQGEGLQRLHCHKLQQPH